VLFDVERTTVAGRPALTVRGELDLVTVPVFAAAVDTAIKSRPAALAIDLTQTTFMDSSGARQLARTAKQATSAEVTLHVVVPKSNGAVRLTIDLLDLGAVVPIVESVDDIPTDSSGRNRDS
jgi:anti-anti-sigma factor